METKQIKLLKALAKKIKSEKREREVVIESLQSAKILTKEENFTGHLKNLDKIFATDI
jgi:hypothetical protein